MSNEINEEKEVSKMLKVLNWAYNTVETGFTGFDSVEGLAKSYGNNGENPIDQVNSLIRWQNTKAGTSGFIAGLGGLITMPVTIPANFASVLLIQIRMIAAIAYIGGYDLKDDQVKTLVYVSLCGSAAKEILKNAGIQLGTKLTVSMIQKYLTAEILKQINKAVGFRLITKAGSTGVINVGKAVPLIGGLIGGSFDLFTTNIIGNTARDIFIVGNHSIK
ncbi:EcsC family protein [Entomomonas asaccharolytica]|uniref:EcsC family protein n=2 Tax=Entomomonas asaccharolytica TaxID=2785331 RepID=A0A974NIG3_9GAMM|nr:EcsC family protein [Entomomonas asaccharolytica]